MRTFVIALCVFASGVLPAQPVITSEIATAPHRLATSPLSTTALPVALARDQHGVAIAWSERNRIHVARLDAFGHIEGAIRELPIRSSSTTVEAHHPSLAPKPSNDGFVIAWIETGRTVPLGVYSFLDADLEHTPPAFLLSNETKSSILVRTGSKIWIATDRDVWEVGDDGFVRLAFGADWPVSGLATAGDFPSVISRPTPTFECSCQLSGGPFKVCPENCKNFHWSLELRLDQRFASISADLMRFETRVEAALATDGTDLLIAWMNGRQPNGGNVVLASLPSSQPALFPAAIAKAIPIGTFGADLRRTRPDIATNGTRHVVVWSDRTASGNYDVVGAAIDATGAITPLEIATSGADERDPSVLALPNGNFLVAYEKIRGLQRSVAWRFVLFEGRRRAVR